MNESDKLLCIFLDGVAILSTGIEQFSKICVERSGLLSPNAQR